jgi:hypothetical protein
MAVLTRSIVLVTLAFWLAVTAVPTAAQTGIQVDPTESLGTISPYVYGANYGPWALVSVEMHEAAAASGVTHFRFPAGNWGDEYDLTRQQIDLCMLQARAWGAEVSISTRLYGGTPEQAAELVRYVNQERGYGVRHWSIGNEPDLYRDYTVEQFNADWRAQALAMRAVDPDIVLIGPEVSQFPATVAGDPYTNVRREWVRAFLEANGDLVDIVSIHRYPFPTSNASPPTTVEQLRQNAGEWRTLIDNLRAVIRETLGRDLPVAITEVNSHWSHVSGGEATPDSRYHAIWWADVLGTLIRERVELVNYFALSTFGANGSYGLLDRYQVRPTYYTYALYRQLGQELVYSQSDAADVSVTAALRPDGALTILIVNLATAAQTVPLTIVGLDRPVSAEVWLLDAEHDAEPIEPETIQSGDAIALRPASATLYVIPAGPES